MTGMVMLLINAKAVDICRALTLLEDDIGRTHGLSPSQRIYPPWVLTDCSLTELLAIVMVYLPEFKAPHGYVKVSVQSYTLRYLMHEEERGGYKREPAYTYINPA